MALPIPKLAGGSKPSPLCSMLFLLVLCILGFYSLHPPHGRLGGSVESRAVRFREIFLSSGSNYTVAAYLRALTQRPHLAGTRQAQEAARFVRAHFEGLGLEAHTARYGALLSYPARAALSAHFSNGSAVGFSLADAPGVVGPYHAYSPSGAAHARAVYVNHGGEGDYRALGALGVSVEGCVAVARKGGALSRGDVVRAAQDRGAVAVLLYAEGDQSLTSTSGGFGKGVERGTVMRGVGDPLSPGWAAVDGGESLDWDAEEVSRRFPKIPSMPISAENAEAILGSLGGAAAPREWAGRVRRVGPGPTRLNFTYQGEKKVAAIQNVFAVIRGSEEPDRYVLLGNHRDAWTYGAVDPNSGTSALLDIARRYALLTRLGWKPRRTIIFCSWDAEEFGMIGSTEWVEQNLGNLGSKAVAYLNVDCAVQGPGFFAGATPQLDNILAEITSKVRDPDSEGATVYENWETKNNGVNIQRLGGVDSDFAPFVQHAGVPSVDIYYGKDFPVYHTAFDSYSWMTTYGDPLFHRHVAVAGIWGLLALRLADDPILPFNYMSYVNELKAYKDALSNLLDGSDVSLNPLVTSIEELASAAREAEDEAKKLRDQESEGEVVVLKKRALNDRLMLAERGFLDADGIPGREWFKHLVYGPQDGRESNLNVFPAVADAVTRSGSGSANTSTRDRRETIQHEIWRLARAIQRAAMALRGQIIM